MNKFRGEAKRTINTQLNWGACLFEEDLHWGSSAGGFNLLSGTARDKTGLIYNQGL
jgi:hypothetical protein